jgi:DNA-binding response OmpR family regulator
MKARKGTFPTRPPGTMAPSAKKILIIDDEQEICEMLYSFLIPHNYKVFLAFNGQMGLEYFEEVKPDIVLIDLKLPDIDGVEVLKILRKVSDVPVVVITGHPQDVADIHLNNLTIEGYLEKPISLRDMLNTLKHIVGE